MENATITNLIQITKECTHNYNGKHTIFIDLPEGWTTLAPLCKRILEYKGKFYAFHAWNSDRNEAWFCETDMMATVGKKIRK